MLVIHLELECVFNVYSWQAFLSSYTVTLGCLITRVITSVLVLKIIGPITGEEFVNVYRQIKTYLYIHQCP